jgi:hypothetical protein
MMEATAVSLARFVLQGVLRSTGSTVADKVASHHVIRFASYRSYI